MYKVSNHAMKRLEERVDVRPENAEDLFRRVIKNGYRVCQLENNLRRYVQKKAEQNDSEGIVFGEMLYLVSKDNVLITVLPLPRGNVLSRQRGRANNWRVRQIKKYYNNYYDEYDNVNNLTAAYYKGRIG